MAKSFSDSTIIYRLGSIKGVNEFLPKSLLSLDEGE
jgi:hypothetical protein